MTILSLVVSCYKLVAEPFIRFICLVSVLCLVSAVFAERAGPQADRLLMPLLTIFWPPLADFPQLWSSIKHTYSVLLDQQLEAMFVLPQLDSFHTALRELTKEAESTSLLDKEGIIRQMNAIISTAESLKAALQDYHSEMDISAYR